MIEYKRINISERIDVKTNKSKESIGIFYIKILVMDHIFVMNAIIFLKNLKILKILLLLIIKSKREPKKLIKKFDLIDKTGSINCND